MEYDINLFKNLKSFYNITFDNLNLVIKQQNRLMEIFIESQPGIYKYTLMNIHQEWDKNCTKALNDYKDMIFKGLDYMDSFCTTNIKKTQHKKTNN